VALQQAFIKDGRLNIAPAAAQPVQAVLGLNSGDSVTFMPYY
jgi:hypothetical protein